MMQDLLYGTYLTFRIKEILDAAKRPLTVRQITRQLAKLSEREHYNLSRRVRKSINQLVFQEEVSKSWHRRENNLIIFTYQTNAHESTGKTEEPGQQHDSRKNGNGDVGAVSSSD
ncbi:hypothetical protein [Lewinella sp. LCG006]|uniref:hypothetical protein n=1 Tax=unclassified Lewinella TaxID=2637037 RepID=UPI00345FB0BC